jgi:hypothetical protein
MFHSSTLYIMVKDRDHGDVKAFQTHPKAMP